MLRIYHYVNLTQKHIVILRLIVCNAYYAILYSI